MTLTLVPPEPAQRRRVTPSGIVRRHAVLLLGLGAAALRLPQVGHAAGSDEAGYLLVGGQWRPGTSLYGDYWVDRPPLLITLYRIAAEAGGLVPLRLVGALAVLLAVLGAATAARRLAPDRHPSVPDPGLWAALVAGALCVSPLLGAAEVDGELLSAPFVAWGLVAASRLVGSGRPPSPGSVLGAGVGAGAAAAAAVLVKQNVVDVVVFTVVALAVGVLTGRVCGPVALRGLAGAGLGGLGVLLLTAAWTAAHGTSLTGAYDAVYPFRLAAGRVLSTAADPALAVRRARVLHLALLTGMPVLVLWGLGAALGRRLTGPGTWGLLAVLAYDGVSVLVSGSFWAHYLVEAAVPAAVLAGLLVAAGGRPARLLAATMATVGLVAWALVPPPATTTAREVGRAIGRAALPWDTVVTAYGHADLTYATHLPSPYPQLWSLPTKTLDPRLTALDRLLAGPRSPTWFVVWSRVASWGVDSTRTTRLLDRRYRPVAHLAGRTVYLRDDVVRPLPCWRAAR